MFKKLKIAVLVFILSLQSTARASALDGLAKFPGKKDATVILEVANTPEKKSKGLMSRPSLAQNKGMVFVFRPERKVTFWMKDTLISLDMIFINKGKIVKIVKNAVPNQTTILYASDFDVTEVIEVNGGFTDNHLISVGGLVTFENISQIDYSGKSKLMIAPK